MLVADDHAIYRTGLVSAVNGRAELELVGEADTGHGALDALWQLHPDVTLVDIDLAGESGLGLVRRLVAEHEEVARRLILISSHAQDEFAELIEASPALGFVAKAELGSEAIEALLAPRAGGEPGSV